MASWSNKTYDVIFMKFSLGSLWFSAAMLIPIVRLAKRPRLLEELNAFSQSLSSPDNHVLRCCQIRNLMWEWPQWVSLLLNFEYEAVFGHVLATVSDFINTFYGRNQGWNQQHLYIHCTPSCIQTFVFHRHFLPNRLYTAFLGGGLRSLCCFLVLRKLP